LISVDDSAAKKVKGVLQVERCERVFGKYRYEAVAVIAENYWAAYKGRKALVVKWDHQGNEKFSSKTFDQGLRDLAKTEGVLDHAQGDFEKSLTGAASKLEAFYETPIVSHSPIEPMNCVASWYDTNKLEIWASTQVSGWYSR
jgi:isoquinoline 1-oxidoreductase beta subunit